MNTFCASVKLWPNEPKLDENINVFIPLSFLNDVTAYSRLG